MHRTSTDRLIAEVAARTTRERWERLAAEPRYVAYEHYYGNSVHGPRGWGIIDGYASECVDVLRTESGARYAAHELNSGRAGIDRHAPLGCRVTPREAPPQTCPECGQTPQGAACYHICPNSDSFYSPEREREDDRMDTGSDDAHERYAATVDDAQYDVLTREWDDGEYELLRLERDMQ